MEMQFTDLLWDTIQILHKNSIVFRELLKWWMNEKFALPNANIRWLQYQIK